MRAVKIYPVSCTVSFGLEKLAIWQSCSKPRIVKRKIGDGEWSRTTDAADMSRVDWDKTY